MTGLVEDFAQGYDFALDDYQVEGCRALESGSGVLVAAPTGAGKTVVGEFAVWLAAHQNRKCFYTTPIKALSNQKYHDLVRRWGADRVGLLTGDTVVNGDAQIVVMTTEVLRNMIYAGSSTLHNLGYVVLDEVHYLADRFRGAVWEEVILGLADSVSIVALSATVSNVEEFGEWLREVRGEMALVVSERRPVPLFQHVLVGRKLLDLFAGVAPTARETPGGQAAPKVNPELLRASRAESLQLRDDSRLPRGRSGRGRRAPYGSGAYGGATHARFVGKRHTVSRPEMVSVLERSGLLPAICFIFSRQGCDQAVRQTSDLRLTTAEERRKLAGIADGHVAGLSVADLDALEYEDFRYALLNGVAAHHAGLLPTFKAIVEEGFASGALKVVFATETLALGINMPARTVVLERLVKYNGETHADITPGEYTQLTGRAGRRGIDTDGHAVVAWQPGMDPRAVAGLASRRTYPLRSSFSPTYNMAVNLVSTQGRERARELLEQSFAQFQADKRVVGASREGKQARRDLAEALAAVECDRGDFMDYARLRQEVSQLEARGAKLRKAAAASEIADSIAALVTGDIVWVPRQGWSVVVGTGTGERRGAGAWVRTLSIDHTVLKIEAHDLRAPLTAVARVRVPKRFSLRERTDRRTLLGGMSAKLERIDPQPPAGERPGADAEHALAVAALRRELAAHPCHGCPDRETHAVLAAKALRLEREIERAQQLTAAAKNSLAASFDKVVAVLTELGYLVDEELTEAGRMLTRVYNELDLVACECVRRGVFDGLDAPALAAVLSCLVYESRMGRPVRPARMPERSSEQAQSALRAVWRDVRALERAHRIDNDREPDIGFAEAAWRWASGQELAKVLSASGLPAGDFVRWTRQVIDLAGQLSQAVGPGDLRRTCRAVVASLRRGVIEYDALED
ncbi:MAG: DEAD/DEAH box helicase [Propionibacteriaceae bacterium]|nr:DEAD/DEAH box helicase [Propionibacteriaceae bacterium]